MLLGAKGVDANARGNGGGTALLFAASRPAGYEVVEALLAKGADVNARNDAGMTSVILASAYGRVPTLEVLIAKGGDVNARTPKGFSALIAAANKGLAATVQLLIEHRAGLRRAERPEQSRRDTQERRGEVSPSEVNRKP
jgi:ankyrin repeat protein